MAVQQDDRGNEAHPDAVAYPKPRLPKKATAEKVQTKAKAAPKPLSERQIAEYQAALKGIQRSIIRSIRANNALQKYQRKVTRYERLIKAAAV